MSGYRALHDGWTLASADLAAIPATVPGCVHTDLLAAGVIADPYLDANEDDLAWVCHTDWTYELGFDWSGAAGRTDLVCAGLDTVATIGVNGVEIGRTANMHRSYRLELGEVLRPGRNTLLIRFTSAYDYAAELAVRIGDRPSAYPEPYNLIRKMACNFGWDWGPRLVTAGIWQPIGLHTWHTARLAEVRPLVTVDGETGRVEVHVGLERTGPDHPVVVAATVAGQRVSAQVPAGESTAVLGLTVPEVERWWPRGHGGQPRYDLDVTLTDATGGELDRWRRRIGFRSVRLDTAPDTEGSAFTVVVNERAVSVRGFNWIPDDCFPHRVDRVRYAARLGQAVETGANFLRVWGGGRYESDDFYDLADELGVLVEQDFLFACAAYPEEQPLAGEVEAEAREQVVRLAHHPSLVLWVGNNENLWGHADWGWTADLGGRSWGAGYYFDLLPGVVAELDPTRPYWPGSPYSGRPELHPNDPSHGTTHIWDVWNTHDYTHYATYRPRFVAEFGFQGPPAYTTLRRAVAEPLAVSSPALLHRQKAVDGNGKLLRGLDGHLPASTNFDDWHWATQLNQARAVSFGVEHLRALHPLCTGTVVWQLNDCWPVISWAAVDGDGRRKPLWYALRRSFAERLLTLQPTVDGLDLVLVNDTDTSWHGQAAAVRVSFDGDPQAKALLDFGVPARGAQRLRVPEEVSRPDDPTAELLTVGDGRTRRSHFFAEDVELQLPAPRYGTRAVATADGTDLTVTAGSLLRDLALFPDRLDPESIVDDMLITLLPGESATFRVRSATALDQDALAAPPVLRCVNDLDIRP
ncbi:MAG: glycoside hydrolase family 2 protein [Labedaea sp.]